MSMVWFQADDPVFETPGLLCGQEEDQAVDAPNGPDGYMSRAAYKLSSSWPSGVSVFTTQPQRDPGEPGLVYRCYVYSASSWICLPGCHYGLAYKAGSFLACLDDPGHQFLSGGTRGSDEKIWQAGDFQY